MFNTKQPTLAAPIAQHHRKVYYRLQIIPEKDVKEEEDTRKGRPLLNASIKMERCKILGSLFPKSDHPVTILKLSVRERVRIVTEG